MTQIIQSGDRWSVQGNVVIDAVNALLKTSQQFALNTNTVVDFSDVKEIDTAAISLILEWKRRAKRENSAFILTNMPDNLKSLAALYGVTEILN